MGNTFGRGAISDGYDTNATNAPTRYFTKTADILIIYFSRSGNTEKQAQFSAKYLGADIYELVSEHPYPANYRASVDRATDEREHQEWPALKINNLPNFTQYKLVLLAHPIWAMTIANPMRSFLIQYGNKLSKKFIADFSTNAGYGSGETQDVLIKLIPNAKLLPNYTVEDRYALNERQKFIAWLDQVKEKR